MNEIELIEEKEQVSFDNFEEQEIKDIKKNKVFYLENGKFSIKKFLATIITTAIVNFGTKWKWQVSLFGFLLVVVPVGTYTSVKWIINLFF